MLAFEHGSKPLSGRDTNRHIGNGGHARGIELQSQFAVHLHGYGLVFGWHYMERRQASMRDI